MTTSSSPTAEIDPVELFADPYPIYAQLRQEAPVAFVPALGRHLVTRYHDVISVSRDWKTFSAREEVRSPEAALTGETMMSFDGTEHLRMRRLMEPALNPRAMREHWEPVFRANTELLLNAISGRGHTDFFTDFATPLAAMNLASFLGFEGVSPDLLVGWCKAIIGASDNYAGDPEVRARGWAARSGVISGVDAAIDRVRGKPDPSMISSMVNADDPMTNEEIYGNIMISIGGGLNEPRDVLLTTMYGLLSNAEQLAMVVANPEQLWRRAFEEACRWVSPIGMFIRQVTAPVDVSGVHLQRGDLVAAALASANRDENVFERPEAFNVMRKEAKHVAFGGGGPHYCIGAWASRSFVATIALPAVFQRLRNLRLDGDVTWGGFVFRGPLTLPVAWDVA